jgi:hypothetical protein
MIGRLKRATRLCAGMARHSIINMNAGKRSAHIRIYHPANVVAAATRGSCTERSPGKEIPLRRTGPRQLPLTQVLASGGITTHSTGAPDSIAFIREPRL